MNPSQEKLTPETARRIESTLIKAIGAPQMQAAFVSGQQAKEKGFMRFTPYYECAPLDHFWFAGYDGKLLQEAAHGL